MASKSFIGTQPPYATPPRNPTLTIVLGGHKPSCLPPPLTRAVCLTADCYKENFAWTWQAVSKTRKPIVAAINGFCLGGGCEVAMMADIMYAGDNAKFAQPEITLGTIPGAGGTQRLVRQIGKSRAMELCLTGEMMGADEALKLGLVSKVFPAAETIPEAIKTATKIASMSQMSVEMCKEAINQSYETGLQQGLLHESRAFWSTFATKDQKEGMGAFVEKRKPDFKDC